MWGVKEFFCPKNRPYKQECMKVSQKYFLSPFFGYSIKLTQLLMLLATNRNSAHFIFEAHIFSVFFLWKIKIKKKRQVFAMLEVEGEKLFHSSSLFEHATWGFPIFTFCRGKNPGKIYSLESFVDCVTMRLGKREKIELRVFN